MSLQSEFEKLCAVMDDAEIYSTYHYGRNDEPDLWGDMKKCLAKIVDDNNTMKKALEEISKGGYIGAVISTANRALEEINP